MPCKWKSVLFVALAVSAASCTSSTEAARQRWAHALEQQRSAVANSPVSKSPLVLVTVDGARWQEIFGGTDPTRTSTPYVEAKDLLPNLYRIERERGALLGSPGRGSIAASGPAFVSLPGYTEILTGRPPEACQSNDCDRTIMPTVLDEAWASGAKVAAFSSWEPIGRAVTIAPGHFFISCGSGGNTAIDPFPGGWHFRPDRMTSAAALSYLEKEQPDVLYVGLGEPDEYAHRGDYEGYLKSLRNADAFLGRLFATLDRMGERGAATNVIMTADHGRASTFRHHGRWAPESARVWLFAAGPGITHHGRVASPEERHLADVAPTIRVLVGLDPDRAADAGRPLAELVEPAATTVARH